MKYIILCCISLQAKPQNWGCSTLNTDTHTSSCTLLYFSTLTRNPKEGREGLSPTVAEPGWSKSVLGLHKLVSPFCLKSDRMLRVMSSLLDCRLASLFLEAFLVARESLLRKVSPAKK